jgi:hypothetical protein
LEKQTSFEIWKKSIKLNSARALLYNLVIFRHKIQFNQPSLIASASTFSIFFFISLFSSFFFRIFMIPFFYFVKLNTNNRIGLSEWENVEWLWRRENWAERIKKNLQVSFILWLLFFFNIVFTSFSFHSQHSKKKEKISLLFNTKRF